MNTLDPDTGKLVNPYLREEWTCVTGKTFIHVETREPIAGRAVVSVPKSKPEIAKLIAHSPQVIAAAVDYFHAVDALAAFEKANPNDSTKRWERLLYARENAEEKLRRLTEEASQ